MDDFWVHSDHSSKHYSAHLSSEVNDEGNRVTCPFCYVEIELSMLCNHFQEEHCFDITNTVCPVCALNMGKDVVGHFRMYHANSNKGRRRSRKSGFWSFSAGKSSVNGQNARNVADLVDGSMPDPLLSPFLCNIPNSESKDDQTEDSSFSENISPINETESSKVSMSSLSEENEDSIEWRQRALFCQQLLFSTIV